MGYAYPHVPSTVKLGLNDARFGVRMHGEGVFADQIAALFTLGCRKAGLQRRDFQLSTAAFRRPIGAQLSLFS
jgi:hypothetical protein